MPNRERMIRMYDRMMRDRDSRRYYENSGFCNFGYWSGGAKSQREASEQLIDQLVGAFQTKEDGCLMSRADRGPPRNGWRWPLRPPRLPASIFPTRRSPM